MGESDRDKVIKTLQAVMISCQGSISLRQCNRDYRSQEGSDIPFRALGYQTLEQLLRSVDSFRVTSKNGELHVDAMGTEETKHLVLMIAKQKNKPRKYLPVRRPHHFAPPPWRGRNHSSYNSWNPPRRYNKPSDNSKPVRIVRSFDRDPSMSPRPIGQHSPSSPPEEAVTREMPPSPTTSSPTTSTSRTPSPTAQNSSSPTVSPAKSISPEPSPKLTGLRPNAFLFNSQSKANGESVHGSGRGRGSGRTTTVGGAALRLSALQLQQSIEVATSPLTYSVPSDPTSSIAQSPVPQGKEGSAERKLWTFCEEHSLPLPVYKELCGSQCRPNQHFCCVKIGSRTFSSYPEAAKSPAEAIAAAATSALLQLPQQLPPPEAKIATVTPEVLQNISTLVARHPAGLYASNLPLQYVRDFQNVLPTDWLKSVEAGLCPNVILEQVANGILVLLPVKEGEPPVLLAPPRDPNDLEDAWSVVVCAAADLDCLTLRFIGPMYSDALDDMTEKLSNYFENASSQANSFHYESEWKAVYSGDGLWHRARLIDGELRYVDISNEIYVPMSPNDVRPLPRQFVTLPCQAFRARIDGLNIILRVEYELVREAARDAVSQLMDHALMAKPNGLWLHSAVVRDVDLSLYDTSGENDIDLNHVIAMKALTAAVAPVPSHIMQKAIVTHVGIDGRVWVAHPDGPRVAEFLLQETLAEVTNFKSFFGRTPILKGELYIVAISNKHVRGQLISSTADGYLRIRLVDSGESVEVCSDQVAALKYISSPLAGLPAQASPICLHGTLAPLDWVSSQMKQLLGPNRELHFILPTAAPQAPKGMPLRDVLEIRNSIVEMFLPNECYDAKMNISKELNRLWKKQSNSGLLRQKTEVHLKDTMETLPELKLPPVNSHFDVYITMAASPSNFIVQPYENLKKLKEMMDALQMACGASNPTPAGENILDICTGQVAALWLPDDGDWHRVLVQECLPDAAACLLLDFGEVVLAPLVRGRIRPLPGCVGDEAPWRSLPPMGIRARLARVSPLHTDWTPEDCVHFQNLCTDCHLVSVVRDRSIPLSLDLIDTRAEEDVWIADLLVSEGRCRLSP